MTDADGAVNEYWYDEHNHLARLVDPLGNVTSLRYDKYGRILEQTDALGNTTRFVRDGAGCAVEQHNPDGTRVLTQYNEFQLPVRVVSAGGASFAFTYDEPGNLTSSTDPLGAVTRYRHNEQGAVTAVTDALGNTTVVEVDRAGLLATLTDALGMTWAVQRTARGLVAGALDPLGNRTTIDYDDAGRPAARVHPDGSRETWAYDVRGNMCWHTDQAGYATTLGYGPFGSLLARVGPDGARYEFGYDSDVRLVSVINPLRAQWTYEYDLGGNLIAERDFNDRRVTYTHDPRGLVVQRTNGAGETVRLARDFRGRVVEQRASDTEFAAFAYDAEGSLVTAANQDARIEFVRDPLGRLLSESIDGRTLAKSYDLLGRRVSRTTPGGRVSNWQYDAAGRPVSFESGQQRITFGYDSAGRETYRWIGADTALTSEWDAQGRLAGRGLLAVTGPEGSRASAQMHERTWTYRADGSPESIRDSVSGARDLRLDALGRVTAVDAATWREQYAYDAAGNLTHAADTRLQENRESSSGLREVSGSLIRRAGRTSSEYDAEGRLVKTVRRTLSGDRRTTTYAYDAHNRMVQARMPDGRCWQYAYDPLGRRIAKRRIGEGGQGGEVLEETLFSWDGTSLAEQTHVRAGREVISTAWDYEPDSWTPLAQDRRTHLADAPQAVIESRFHAIVTDLIGTPTELVAVDGTVAWRRDADLWGSARGTDAAAADCPLRFPGQYHDPETGLDYNHQRYYDPTTAHYTAPDPLGLNPAPNHHGYVDNPLTSSDALGLAGSYGPPLPVRPGQQVPGRTYALSPAERNFVNRLAELKPNFQIFRTDGTASQGDFVVMDLSDPKKLVGWNVELKAAHGGFPGEQFRNSAELESSIRDHYRQNTRLRPDPVRIKPIAGTPDEILEALNKGRGEWCDK